MTNFDSLKTEQFAAFADTAIAAERTYAIDPATCVLNCRRAMEFAVNRLHPPKRNLDFGDYALSISQQPYKYRSL